MGLISRVSSRTYRLSCNHNKKPSLKPKSTMASELAVTYAALTLQDEGMDITADNLSTLVKAAGVSVEPFWPGLFEKALASVNVAELITNIGSGVGAAPAAGGAAAGGAAADEAPKEEAKKEESEEESDSDMGFDLFG